MRIATFLFFIIFYFFMSVEFSTSEYLFIAADSTFDTLQLGVADLSELVLWHGDDSIALGDELAAVANKAAVVTRKRLQDL